MSVDLVWVRLASDVGDAESLVELVVDPWASVSGLACCPDSSSFAVAGLAVAGLGPGLASGVIVVALPDLEYASPSTDSVSVQLADYIHPEMISIHFPVEFFIESYLIGRLVEYILLELEPDLNHFADSRGIRLALTCKS